MKIYEIIKGIAEELEKDRIMVLEAEKKIYSDEDITIKRKNEMVQEIYQKYSEKVKKANSNKDTIIDEFIMKKSKEAIKVNAAKLNEILGIIKNISNHLEDEELFELTKDIQKDYMSMGILRKELEDPIKYQKTFEELNKKELIDSILAKLLSFKGLYFSSEINYTHLRYSLNKLMEIDNELESIELGQNIPIFSSYVNNSENPID